MMKLRIRSVASALVLSALAFGGAFHVPTAVAAEKAEKKQAAAKQPKPSKKVHKPLVEAQKLVEAKDFANAKTKIAELEAMSDLTEDDRYFIASLKYNTGQGLNDNAMVESALEQMATNSFTADKDKIQRALMSLALQQENHPKAIERAKTLLAANPNDASLMMDLGRIYYMTDDYNNALASLKQGIETAKKNGQQPDETSYKLVAQAALQAKNNAEVMSAMKALVSAYPSATNWRDTLVLFRDQAGLTDPIILDSYRLQWVNNALSGERDYIEMAELALKRGLPGEAKAVLEKGTSTNVFAKAKALATELLTTSRNRSAADQKELPALEKEARTAKTGDMAASTVGQAYLSYGNFPKAVEFYKLGLQKGVKNRDEANLQLGMALIGAGQVQEASAAFAEVKGSLKQLADLWAVHAANVSKSGGTAAQ